MITMIANEVCTLSVSPLINLSGLLLFQIFPFEIRTKTSRLFILSHGERRIESVCISPLTDIHCSGGRPDLVQITAGGSILSI
jgi:hypothetical protein